jgi:hypothetical protein
MVSSFLAALGPFPTCRDPSIVFLAHKTTLRGRILRGIILARAEEELLAMTSREDTVDPIQYAWGHCNPGLAFPKSLGRTILRDPLPTPANEEAAATRRATHSEIVGKRAPRPAISHET